jgi:hypothetical protein
METSGGVGKKSKPGALPIPVAVGLSNNTLQRTDFIAGVLEVAIRGARSETSSRPQDVWRGGL